MISLLCYVKVMNEVYIKLELKIAESSITLGRHFLLFQTIEEKYLHSW